MKIRTLALVALSTGACTEHIAPYHAKHRDFDTGSYDTQPLGAPGSLYSSNARSLFDNDRARRLGDVIVITINEADSGSHNAASALSTTSSASIDSSGLLDLLKKAGVNAIAFGAQPLEGGHRAERRLAADRWRLAVKN